MQQQVLPEKVVKLCSCDGQVYVLEHDLLEMCATLKSILRGKTAFKNGLGGLFSVDNGFVVLKSEGKVLASIVRNTQEEIYLSFPDVKGEVLERVFEYCRYQGMGHTEREKRSWEAEFVQVKQGLLCEVASAAYYLDIKPLVNLTSRAIASQISTKTSEELRETFSNVNCDLYVPMFATRCRLHRKMVQKKSKALSDSPEPPVYQHQHICTHPPDAPHTVECCTLPVPASHQSHSHSHSHSNTHSHPSSPTSSTSSTFSDSDNRSLDELLEFIGGEDKTSKKKEKKKPKKQNKKKDDGKKDKDNNYTQKNKTDKQITEIQIAEEETEELEEEEEELSPEIQAEIDKEVEEFRLRLESISRNKPSISKITLPSAISASLSSLQVY